MDRAVLSVRVSWSLLRRPLAWLLAAAGGALVAGILVALVSWGAFVRGQLPNWESALLRYQIDKLEAAAPADVVLVGDSSLGNAIDARRWSEALDRPVLSLALSGDFGYAGSLNMLRRTLERWTPKLVVVMHTADIATRPVPYWSRLVTAPSLRDIDPRALIPGLYQLYRSQALVDLLKDEPPDRDAGATFAARDYVGQGTSLADIGGRALDGRDRLLRHGPRDGNEHDLAALGELCREHGIACVYATGPLVEPLCSESVPLLRKTAAIVDASGLRPLPGAPVCIPLTAVGDAADHVAPRFREQFSDRYLALLEASGALAALDDGRLPETANWAGAGGDPPS
ncbi:MAG: hypothetical protein U1E14_02410 [Geminicoccaceae bacterium]